MYAELLTINQIISLEQIKLVHKIKLGKISNEIYLVCNHNIHCHNSRNANNLHIGHDSTEKIL